MMVLRTAYDLALSLMREHGLIGTCEPVRRMNGDVSTLPTPEKDWTFDFDRSRRRFGACHHTEKKITLSYSIVGLNDEAQVRDTILHEIAHAICGTKAGHGTEWQACAVRIGANGRRCYNSPAEIAETGKTVQVLPSRLIMRCPKCGQETPRNRRPRGPRACKACCNRYNHGRFDIRFQLEWRYRSR